MGLTISSLSRNIHLSEEIQMRSKIRFPFIPLQFQYLLFFALFLAACAGKTSSPTTPAIITLDEVCQGISGYSFLSTTAFLLGETERGPLYGPRIVAFLPDGRVVWKYSLEANIGTFTCENGRFSATFEEGEHSSFEGIYDAVTDTIVIEQLRYLKALNE